VGLCDTHPSAGHSSKQAGGVLGGALPHTPQRRAFLKTGWGSLGWGSVTPPPAQSPSLWTARHTRRHQPPAPPALRCVPPWTVGLGAGGPAGAPLHPPQEHWQPPLTGEWATRRQSNGPPRPPLLVPGPQMSAAGTHWHCCQAGAGCPLRHTPQIAPVRRGQAATVAAAWSVLELLGTHAARREWTPLGLWPPAPGACDEGGAADDDPP